MGEVSGAVGKMFVGCATDRKFVEPTCTMLSSLEDNGGIAEATIMVADFGLEDADRAFIRDSAGSMRRTMRFVSIPRDSPKIVAMPAFDFPFPLIGRLILPGEITEPGARLLLIDSDVVVNHSLAPLFDMNLGGHPLAAVQDPLMAAEWEYWRLPNDYYFNAGFMLLDLDLFNGRKLGEACMRRFAAYDPPPRYLDQDAMNAVIGDDWLQLDRRWNFFHCGHDRSFSLEDFEAAHVVHFAGPKPWENRTVTPITIYDHHASRAAAKIGWKARLDARPVDRDFIATCYEVLLGRELEDEQIIRDRIHFSASGMLESIINSAEFRQGLVPAIERGAMPSEHLFRDTPTLRQRYWAADRLPVLDQTAATIERARDWRALLVAVVADPRIRTLADLD